MNADSKLSWIGYGLALAVLALLSLAACTLETEQPALEGKTVRLTVLRTSDIHSRLFPYNLKPNSHDQGDGLFEETAPYGGLERIAALIERERRRGQRVVYLESGDIFQGAPVFNYGAGEPEFRWLSTIEADAMVVGNHEFDKGAANLAEQAAHWVNFPFLAANYIFEDWTEDENNALGRIVQPYTIVNAKGVRLGIIGMGDIGSMYSITQGGNSMGITPLEANETVRAYVEFLSPAVDLVIVLSHLGLTEDQELTDGHAIYLSRDKNVWPFIEREHDPWKRMACDECADNVVKYWVPGVRGIDAILGGHLHILTRPPMLLTDPAGRKVLLEHPGAFAKFMTRLDLMVAMPHDTYHCDTEAGLCAPQDNHFSRGVTCTTDADCDIRKLAPYGPEIVAHTQKLFPLDSIWCLEPRPQDRWDDEEYFSWYYLKALKGYCDARGHGPTRNLLEPYRVDMELDPLFDLTQVFGYAPKAINRKDTAGGGDAPLGNMTALAMMIRKRVEAEFCVTNTLGIRDNLYPGVLNMETIFNVFPFENTITVMYLSGSEIQELFDFITERSGGRGCQSQAQIAGCSFVMNCGQAKRNEEHYRCSSAEDCCPYRPEICAEGYSGTARWECREGACYAHPAEDITVGTVTLGDGSVVKRPLELNASYRMATNDYIAAGGSGFNVLKRNTTKVNTGIAMRDSLTEYLARFPSCEDLLAADPNQVDPFSLAFCLDHQSDEAQREILVQGSCTCGDVLDGDPKNRCDALGPALVKFCQNPLKYPIVVNESDGRITAKVN
ncbi:MAG: bifunctional metallophosphatase/5'-nucleotidase [Deltaproteobacteria bacterium]|nr:bifunctional metallophosphatase/5'-nucleotidase [Deltaproteobacteria bacterium]